MESNRNLSSIISKIRDEGPPVAEAIPTQTTPAGYVNPAARSGHVQGSRPMRMLVLLLLCIGIVAGAVFYILRLYGGGAWPGWLQSLPDPGVTHPAMPAGQAPIEPVADRQLLPDAAVLEGLSERIGRLQTRLDEMGSAMASREEFNEMRNAKLDAAIGDMDERQRAELERLQGRLDTLQSRMDSWQANKQASKPPVPAKKPLAAQAAATVATPAAETAKTTADNMPGQAGTAEWVVNIASSTLPAQIDEVESRMRRLGVSVERQVVDFGGEMRYRLRITGFPTIAAARSYEMKLEQEMGIKDAWVSRR
jgi:hypothetical protein